MSHTPEPPIRVGSTVDVVSASGLGTGGDTLVTAITADEIHCGGHHFSRTTGEALNPPRAYYIADLERRGVVGPEDTSVPMFSADAARKLRDQALGDPKGVTIGPILVFVHERIRRAAEEGRSEIDHPFLRSNAASPEWPKNVDYPAPAVKESVYKALRLEGYTVIHHPDPNQEGHPCSGAYTSVSW